MPTRVLLALSIVSIAGCFDFCSSRPDPDGTGGTSGQFRIKGQVRAGQTSLTNAKVEVKRAGMVLASGDASGGSFSVRVNPMGAEMLLVTARADGYAPAQRAVKASPVGEVELDLQMLLLPDLTCTGTTCSAGKLLIEGLPLGVRGKGRAFNPVTEVDAFPGGFDDAEGNLLISGAFATVELTNAQGQPMTQMGSPATLRMPIPKDTWPEIVDVTPGDNKITVPLFFFDEALATWKREGQADLVTASGALVADSSLMALRAKTFGEDVFASGQVMHFSTWNVDWPISSHGCVTGRMLGADGGVQQSITVEATGATYNGRSPSQVTGADGRFCTDVLRSEAPGEDVNRNGITGETQKVDVYITQGDELYDGRQQEVPAMQGSCSMGSCLDLGDVTLDESRRFVPQLCALSGVLVDAAGMPVANQMVSASSNPSLTTEQIQAFCPNYTCAQLSARTDAQGRFMGQVAMRARINVVAFATDRNDAGAERVRQAYKEVRGCPTSPVQIAYGPPLVTTQVTVTAAGTTISWAPNLPVTLVSVSSPGSSSQPKWFVTTQTGFVGPVTFGQAPAGAQTVFGPNGSLASGDQVTVFGSEMAGGEQRINQGQTVVR
jgi:hypothetical protein